MSIRSFADVIATTNNYKDLMFRIHKLLQIYSKTKAGLFQHKTLPRYTYIKIEKVEEHSITVGLYHIRGTEHYSYEPIVDEMAGPPGLGIGWEPSGEDIIGSREVYDHTTYSMNHLLSVVIPSADIGIADDSELVMVEARYQKIYDERKAQAEREALTKQIAKTKEDLSDMEKKLGVFA